MPIKNEAKVIDGKHVSVTQFGGGRGLRLQLKLLRLLSPAMKALKGSDTDSVMDTELNIGTILSALSYSLQNDETLFNLVFELLAECRVEEREVAQKPVFDDIFAGDYGLLYKVLYYVLDVNYGRLFRGGTIGNVFRSPDPVVPESAR